jgi:proline dehydrogenase
MVNRVLMWAAGSPGLQRQFTGNSIARRAEHRFVAGEWLDEALDVAAALNSRRIGGILDLLAEGVTDLSGVSHAVADHGPPSTPATRAWGADAVPASGHAAESTARPSGAGDASIARAHRAPTEHRSR